MIYIGICDDSERDRINLQMLCKMYFEKNSMEYEMISFQSGEEVWAYCEQKDHPRIDLLFLDIEMPGEGGIVLKERVRRQNLVWRIVFVTSHEEKVYDSFGQKCIGFEKKPVSSSRIEHWIRYVQEELEEEVYVELSDTILRENQLVRVEDIVYARADGNYTVIYVYASKGKMQEILLGMKIGQLEKQLKAYPVVRVHKSYLVNLTNVAEMRSSIKMHVAEEEIPIGRTYRDEVKRSYLEYGRKVSLLQNDTGKKRFKIIWI